ncbi:MAG: DUF6265 family protein [Flavobacteriaceae bacterium]|nr:DUF6265 family protein [Flavobacteriaceae bacterium]
MKTSIVFIIFIALFSCSENKLSQLDFLVGTWKMEGKENYESWEKLDHILKGKSYKIVDGQKIVTEIIELKSDGNQIFYTPTVFDQNEGKPIQFILLKLNKNEFSFENSDHDFPKKIQYKKYSENELLISVFGENDKGFSYRLIKQTDK